MFVCFFVFPVKGTHLHSVLQIPEGSLLTSVITSGLPRNTQQIKLLRDEWAVRSTHM